MIQKIKTIRNYHNEEGFTLIELMIVVVVIGILTAIAIPIFANQQRSAIQAGMKNDVRNLQGIVATYLVKNPTATNLQWRYQNGAQTNNKALNNDADWQRLIAGFSTSDPATIITIRESRSISPEVIGTWQNYAVVAANIPASPNDNYTYYYYTSSTGKYTLENG